MNPIYPPLSIGYLQGNLRSLKILFLSIGIVYTLRTVQFVLILAYSFAVGDVLDPYIMVAKTAMILGFFISIYMRIQTANGNLQTDVDLIRDGSVRLLTLEALESQGSINDTETDG
jgi:hypothetical protein